MVKKIDRQEHTDKNYKNERFELAKNTLEIKKYFKAITDEFTHDNAIFIFGQGKAQEELKNALKQIHILKTKTIELGTSAKISINQIIARVAEYFEEEL